jgi:hypothetical protein
MTTLTKTIDNVDIRILKLFTDEDYKQSPALVSHVWGARRAREPSVFLRGVDDFQRLCVPILFGCTYPRVHPLFS